MASARLLPLVRDQERGLSQSPDVMGERGLHVLRTHKHTLTHTKIKIRQHLSSQKERKTKRMLHFEYGILL